ncbi:MAG: enoyl-CoA hydratase/isomerase family protein [Alphaproteobacteria bacterium]|nr:enoyl-CoA hydratase/isomerase family protein [Alphaproteobacteria bacterium]
MADTDILLQEDRGSTRILTLNRPRRLNALNGALVEAICGAVSQAHGDDGVACILLQGNERAFSAGADMKEAADHAGEGLRAARDRAEAGAAIYELGRLTDKPLIAAVRGYALGGGCNLAIACDLAVAGASAVFGYPEVRRGLAATMVTPGLAHRIGPKAAFELLTLAEDVSANRALELGMINRVVPDERVLDEALSMAEALAAFDREAVRATKRVFQRSLDLPAADALSAARETMLSMRRGMVPPE